MGGVANAIAVFLVMTVVLCVCCVAAALHMLRVRNRVVPDVRSSAPLGWLWSPRAAARMHRRLRGSVLGARMALPPGSVLADVAREIEQRAASLDRELVAADRARAPARSRLVADLRDEVAEVEALNQRLVTMSRSRRHDLGAVRERLDALDAALRELELPEAGATA
jgi:hypothetical protein